MSPTKPEDKDGEGGALVLMSLDVDYSQPADPKEDPHVTRLD